MPYLVFFSGRGTRGIFLWQSEGGGGGKAYFRNDFTIYIQEILFFQGGPDPPTPSPSPIRAYVKYRFHFTIRWIVGRGVYLSEIQSFGVLCMLFNLLNNTTIK